jgi:hypothetical protein
LSSDPDDRSGRVSRRNSALSDEYDDEIDEDEDSGDEDDEDEDDEDSDDEDSDEDED